MHFFRRLYVWVLRWAETPNAQWALFGIAVAESSFFPIPPDVLLIAMCVAAPRRSFRYALVCSLASVLGGALGYLIGFQFYEVLGKPIIRVYSLGDEYLRVQELYRRYDALAVAAAGFTPIPYKLATIAAGTFQIDFWRFLVASLLSRSARFFLVAGLIRVFGESIQRLIENYFNWLTVGFFALLIGGFFVVKYFL